MSGLNLHEFNVLSEKHNYFLTNNRKNGFPSITEYSKILKKILVNKNSNSNDKILEFKRNKPNKIIHFPNKNKQITINEQSPLKVKRNPYTANKNYNNKNYQIYSYNNTEAENTPTVSPYKYNSRLITNNDSIKEMYYKAQKNIQNNITKNPRLYNRFSNYSSYSNINDLENEMTILKHKGKKIFQRNNIFFTPNKNDNRMKVTELYRNSEELNKKRDSIYQRKIKRESSSIKREILKRAKDKGLKNGKLNSIIKSVNSSIDNDTSKNKYKIKMRNKNEINDNNNQFKVIDNNKNNTYNSNSSNIVSYQNSNNNSIQSKDIRIRRINKYKISRNNNATCSQPINNNTKNKNIYQINTNNTAYDSNSSFKAYNVYLSQGIEHSPPKNIRCININNKIKENLNYLRKQEAIPSKETNHSFNNRIISPEKHNYPYNFATTTKKRFIEDYTYEPPIIYSKDKKVSIKVHTLQNLNETFLGKKMTREKLKLQRVISVFIENTNKNKRGYFRNNNDSKKINEHKHLKSIKEEEKSLTNELKSNLIETESEKEKKQKPVFQRNIRMKYISRIQNKK